MKKNVQRKELKDIIAHAIDYGMNKADEKVIEIGVCLQNWQSGISHKWVRTDLTIYDDSNTTYEFTDREISDTYLNMVIEEQIKLKGIKATINYYHDTSIVKGITFFGTPCDDFNEAQRIIKERTRRTLDPSKVFYVGVCGKRSAWGDSGRKYYLAYDEKTSKALLQYVKKNDIVKFETIDYFSHGDDYDYDHAIYAETEWYGHRGTYLKLTTKDNKTRTYYLQE